MVYAFAFMFYRCRTKSMRHNAAVYCAGRCRVPSAVLDIFRSFVRTFAFNHSKVSSICLTRAYFVFPFHSPPFLFHSLSFPFHFHLNDDSRNGNIFSLSFIFECFDLFFPILTPSPPPLPSLCPPPPSSPYAAIHPIPTDSVNVLSCPLHFRS